MLKLKNDRFLRAIEKQPVDATPVWIMRQAGRYLPEYRKVRERAGSFMSLCQTPELACEVTLQPVKRFALDAAILFSDILTIPDAMGLELQFTEGKGPAFKKSLKSLADIEALSVVDIGELSYVYDAIALIQRELNGKIPLIGFCGSPWTLACYMLEGAANPGFPRIKTLLNESPQMLHQLLTILAQSVTEHLNAQIEAGVDAVMIFDTWGGLLAANEYETYSLQYQKQIMQSLIKHYDHKKIPVILFTKGGAAFLNSIAESGCDVVGLDWEVSLTQARQSIGDKVALQGNLNPTVLLETPEKIEQSVLQLLQDYGQGSGHIFNLGHGITPDVPPEHVNVLVNAVHQFSAKFHAK